MYLMQQCRCRYKNKAYNRDIMHSLCYRALNQDQFHRHDVWQSLVTLPDKKDRVR